MKSLTCFSSRSRGTCCAVILERLAENCRGRTTAIICTRTNAPKYILESHRLHFGSICDQNGRNFEPCFNALALTVHGPSIVPLMQCSCPVPLSKKTPPKHNVSTSMFDGGDGVLGIIGCHGAHTREEQEHADEDINSNDNI